MSVVPNDRLGKLEFYEAHVDAWGDNAVAIGLTLAEVNTFKGFVSSARSAFTASDIARAASKSATQNFYSSITKVSDIGSGLMSKIRGFAEATQNTNVYLLAQIPPPSTGTPVPPPGTPQDFRVELLQDGSIVLRWKCPNPSGAAGTIYEVRRKISGTPANPWTFIGATGIRSFTDDTIPNTPSATYQITAVRSTARGNPAQFIVNFGVGGDGITITNVTEESPARLAA